MKETLAYIIVVKNACGDSYCFDDDGIALFSDRKSAESNLLDSIDEVIEKVTVFHNGTISNDNRSWNDIKEELESQDRNIDNAMVLHKKFFEDNFRGEE